MFAQLKLGERIVTHRQHSLQVLTLKRVTHFKDMYTVSQQLHYSDSLLISYSFYMFRRMYVIIREPSFVCPAELH
jgi:hypothetical protein